jgi:hypothetical protein
MVADDHLPTRVPGRNMSHQPAAVADGESSDADPSRPARVHELLTRHDLGKRRGRGEGVDPGASARAASPPPDFRRPDLLRPNVHGEDER